MATLTPTDGAPVPMLEVRGLNRRFGSLRALADVSLDVHAGEIVAVIGPNGAGKSTLVNVIAGADSGWTGEVRFRGEDLRRGHADRHARSGIARTFQVAQPFRGMTVLENVMVGATHGHRERRGVAGATRAAMDLLHEFGLADRAGTEATQLNVPERKRLEIARALSTEPDLLLLDEVMAGLNPVEVEHAVALIRRVHERGVTILLIEHVMQVIASLSDRIVVLHHGQKLLEGTPDAVLEHPEVIDAYLGARYRRRTGQG